MNKIKFTFESVEDAKTAEELFNHKIMFIHGAAMTEILVSAGDRKEAASLLDEKGISYTMR